MSLHTHTRAATHPVESRDGQANHKFTRGDPYCSFWHFGVVAVHQNLFVRLMFSVELPVGLNHFIELSIR